MITEVTILKENKKEYVTERKCKKKMIDLHQYQNKRNN